MHKAFTHYLKYEIPLNVLSQYSTYEIWSYFWTAWLSRWSSCGPSEHQNKLAQQHRIVSNVSGHGLDNHSSIVSNVSGHGLDNHSSIVSNVSGHGLDNHTSIVSNVSGHGLDNHSSIVSNVSGHVLDNHSSIPYWGTNLFLLTTVSKEAVEPTHPAPSSTGSFSMGKSSYRMNLATHVHFMCRIRMHWTLPPLPLYLHDTTELKHSHNFTSVSQMQLKCMSCHTSCRTWTVHNKRWQALNTRSDRLHMEWQIQHTAACKRFLQRK
jgi:hypothetical protein